MYFEPALKAVLIELRAHAVAGTVPDPDVGICSNVQRRVRCAGLEALMDWLELRMAAWPAGTGRTAYPIPSTLDGVAACEQYHNHRDSLWVGKQLTLRIQLIDYLLGQCHD